VAQGVLERRDDRIAAPVEVISRLAGMDEPRKALAGVISGLDIHYDLGAGHPQLGRRIPDLDLNTSCGPLRMFQTLHRARPVLLNLGDPASLDITPWGDRVRLVDATYEKPWELPVLGTVEAPTAVHVRPDGYVAWVGHATDEGLADALATWFGPASFRGGAGSGRARRPPREPHLPPARRPDHSGCAMFSRC
jgi:3-(3-hydroxy-phenyl)propionate hydroxylase